MNLLLLTEAELSPGGLAAIEGPRARHVLDVLGAAPGRSLRIGRVDGPFGTGIVRACAADRVEIECAFAGEIPQRPEDTLLLAVPRPKVLRRCLEHAAALGFGHIVLMRTWRVDKSHLGSRELEPDRIRHHLLLGLEQGCRTRVPDVRLAPRFRPFVEDDLEAVVPTGARVVAHPDAETDTAHLTVAPDRPIALAIGPERGFTDHELARFHDRGFVPVAAGRHPLRVETALAFVFGQLLLLRERARGRSPIDAG